MRIVKFEPFLRDEKAHYINVDSVVSVREVWVDQRQRSVTYVDYGPMGRHTILCQESVGEVLKKVGWEVSE